MLAPRPAALAFAAAVAACTATAPATPSPTATPAAEPAPQDLIDVMHAIEDHYGTIERALQRQPLGDLREVAAAATAAAGLVRLGYGPHEDKKVPGFARLAQESESWFLQLALEARQAHGEIVRELFRGGEKQHCTRCHDAHEKVHG